MVLAIGILFFGAVVLLFVALLPDESQRAIRRRIYEEVATDKRPTLLDQLAKLLAPVNQYLPLRDYTAHTTRLLAGASLRMHPLNFLVLQEVCAMSGGAGVLFYFFIFGGGEVQLVWLVLFILGGFLTPYIWLHNVKQERRMSVTRDLPAVVDLLNLSVSAGSDFISALGRIVREFRACPVREELGIVLQEIRMGKRRRDALRAFADRLKTTEASAFARTLIQVDRMGKGLTEALQVLAEDMQLSLYHWAERFAQQAPLKMLLPLLMSLAAALIIVAGPILGQFLRGGFMGMGAGGAGFTPE